MVRKTLTTYTPTTTTTLPLPQTCGPVTYTAICPAVSITPTLTRMGDRTLEDFTDEYTFLANASSGGPADLPQGGCCVVDECIGLTAFSPTAGLSLSYDEIDDYDQFESPIHLSTQFLGTSMALRCGVGTAIDSPYGSTDYEFTTQPHFTPSDPPWNWPDSIVHATWDGPPFATVSGQTPISLTEADQQSQILMETLLPSTWRFVSQTLSIDKVCAEDQLMQGHATLSLIKLDGTPCTVTVYAQGTRSVNR
jgi:hypothetical protein